MKAAFLHLLRVTCSLIIAVTFGLLLVKGAGIIGLPEYTGRLLAIANAGLAFLFVMGITGLYINPPREEIDKDHSDE